MIQMINESLLSVIILFMYMLYIVRKANKRKGQEHAQGLIKE